MTKEQEKEIIRDVKKWIKETQSHGGTSFELQAVAVDGRYEALMQVIYKEDVR